MPDTASRQHDMTIKPEDGYPLAATLFEPAGEARFPLLIGSALGVPRYYYFKFARFMAGEGFPSLAFDYRGIHESREETKPGSEMKMEHWGTLDLDAALGWLARRYPERPPAYVGHSCGGQLIGLAPRSEYLRAMVFVAAQSGYWKLWSRPYRWGVWLTWHTLPLLAPFFDYIPARLMGISTVNLPAGVARQWARWGKSPRYLFGPEHGLDTSRYPEFRLPLLSYLIEDDPFFAPPAAVEALLEEYPSADRELRRVAPEDYGQSSIGHFGFFRERFRETLWRDTAAWLASRRISG